MKELWSRVTAAWDNLGDRERLLVSVAVGALLLTLAYLLLVMPALAARSSIGERVAAAEQELRAMQRLRHEYDEVRGRLETVETRIRAGRRGNLRTTLETFAQQSGVKIESMEPQSSPANQHYKETKVEVALKAVSLPQTVSYLRRIQEAQEVLSVKSLRIRTRADAKELLDVTFTVSSFEPV